MGFIIITALLMVSWIVIQVWPVTVMKPNVQPYKVVTKQVRVGGQLVYIVDACKYLTTTGIVTRTFADGVRYPSIITTGFVKPGCSSTKVSVLVPNYVVPGTYHLELSIQYQINPFRADTYQFTTDNFEVLPAASTSSVLQLTK